MPSDIEIQVRWDGLKETRGARPSAEIEYMAKGTDDADKATSAVQAFAAPSVIIAADTPNPVELPMTDVELTGRIAHDIYGVMVKYGTGEPSTSTPEDETISLDTTGTRAKIMQSLNTRIYPAAGVTAPNFHGAIGVTKNGIEGVEITLPGLSITRKKRFEPGELTDEYVNLIANLTGKYNNAPFKGREMGEVRFDGATGDQKNLMDSAEVSFKFTISPNKTNFPVAGITVESKLGWQYLWVLYEETEDTAAKWTVQRAIAVYVEDLPGLEPDDLSQLGI